ncbi:hypothetical protein CLCAR_1778 [Clostridium carboxidivorans P7]|nr:hypothetical protein CLCAR_1778 [Clostridium carboxidivorans P7]
MGEVIHGDYNIWANENMLDSITNYECYKGIYSSLNDKNYFEINYSLNRQFGEHGIYKNLNLYNFIDNHDVTRISSILNNPNHIYLAYTMLFTMPGIPSIYYGSEYGIKGKKEKNSDLALRPSLSEITNETLNEDIFNLIAQLSKIRTSSPSLKFGIYKEIVIKNEQIVFARIHNKETILVVLNLSDKEISSFKFNIPNYGTYLVDLLDNNKEYTLINGTITLNLEPYCKKILKVC